MTITACFCGTRQIYQQLPLHEKREEGTH